MSQAAIIAEDLSRMTLEQRREVLKDIKLFDAMLWQDVKKELQKLKDSAH